VPDPVRFGVANLSPSGNVVALEEKPQNPVSDAAITGLYFLDGSAVERAKKLRLSDRGELEIIDLLTSYLEDSQLVAVEMPRGTMWLDTGTVQSLLDAAVYVNSFQSHTGQLIGSPEEVALRNNWITKDNLQRLAREIKTSYGEMLLKVCLEK
jgi:glucose-1-phosphate thymidylyltransferase